jgi:hypothetical protein
MRVFSGPQAFEPSEPARRNIKRAGDQGANDQQGHCGERDG